MNCEDDTNSDSDYDDEAEDEEDQTSSVTSEELSKRKAESTLKNSEDVDSGSQYGLGRRRTGPTKA